MRLFTSFFVFALLIFPSVVFGSDHLGLVPCDGGASDPCQACDLVELVNNIVTWLIGILALVAVFLIVVAGFKLVISGGNPAAKEEAKKLLANAIIGFVLVLSAWLIVDTLMKALIDNERLEEAGFGPWNQIECVDQPELEGGGTGEAGEAGGTPEDPNIVAECTDDAALIARYSGSLMRVEAPGLRTMINCYLADSAVSSITDTGQLYTFDRTHPRCSLTNGNRVCGPCSHSNNSMHYGRGSGLGAKAVDFNSSGASETELLNRLRARQSVCGGSIIFESNHTHISI